MKLHNCLVSFKYLLPYVDKSFLGLVVMGGDSCSEGCGFESQHQILEHQILDGHFSHLFVIKIVMIVVKDKNK